MFNTPLWKHVSTDMLQWPPTPPTPRNGNVKTMKQSLSCPVVPNDDPDADASAAAFLKPFFLMDWLDQVDPEDLELARQMLHSPRKQQEQQTSKARQLKLSPPPSGQLKQPVALSKQSCEGDPANKPPQEVLSPTSVVDKEPAKGGSSICRRLYPPTPPSQDLCKDSNEEEAATPGVVSPEESLVLNLNEEVAPPPAPSVAAMSPFKKRSIGIGNGWNAKGLLKAKKGKWEEALLCWENALEIRAQVLGEDHPDVANTRNNMGIALGKLGRFTKAMEMLELALDIRTRHYGTREHPEVAATLHNMGNVLHQAQDRAGAIQYYWDAKLIQEQTLGHNHIQVARSCVSIGNVYYEAVQYDDAREAYLDALHIFARAGLGKTHDEVMAVMQDLQEMESLRVPHVANSNNNTACVHQQQHSHQSTQQHTDNQYLYHHPHHQLHHYPQEPSPVQPHPLR